VRAAVYAGEMYVETDYDGAPVVADLADLGMALMALQSQADGFIPAWALSGAPDWEERAARLVKAGVWELAPGGFRLVNWLGVVDVLPE
jgi:hypothetical protein